VSSIVETLENNEELKNELNELVQRIEESPITFYQNEKIANCIELLLSDDDLKDNIYNKVKGLDEDISEILDNFGKDIEEKVASKYKNVNYVTITSVILDDTFEKIKQLEADYRHHKYNKNYYNRELNKILAQIEDLKNIHDYESVQEEIIRLKSDVYSKSKDKYDLLFNTEVFENINNTCNDLLQKVNRRIVDIRKSEKKEKKPDKNKEERNIEREREKEKFEQHIEEEKIRERQENLLKHFKDLELARKILLITNSEILLPKRNRELLEAIDRFYYEFLNGEKVSFFFERNRTKTELMKLYNNMNRLTCMLQNQEFVFSDHINYRMVDLLDATSTKKSELESILESKYHYRKEGHEASILVNNKLDLLYEKEKEHQRIHDGPVKMITHPNQNMMNR